MPVPARQPDAYYTDILAAIRRQLPPGLAIAPYVEATNPPPPPVARHGEVQRLSSKRLILRHPQSQYTRAEDRQGRPYTMTTIRREANALVETIRRAEAA